MQFIETGEKFRVRFAPSPTGFLHVGGARTAIFNWLFARKYGGDFLLRIEDTDVERSGEAMVDAILEGLQWLGLNWDEEVIYQSHRLELYDRYIAQLIDAGKAYKCYCAVEEIDADRAQARAAKRDYRYNATGKCRHLSTAEIDACERAGKPHVVRFLLPEGQTTFEDAVYGNISVDHRQLDDFIIRRSDGFPTYHLAVVVDDHEMGITHIIRGDDHLSNTPKHVLLYRAFGWAAPKFGHVPLILGNDKQRLSKRHGATAVGEYAKAGYLPEAMFNFLSILGWSSGDDRELFSREELIAEFSADGIQKKSAVFDEKKLEWMNGQYINAMPAEQFYDLLVTSLIESCTIDAQFAEAKTAYLERVAELIQPRLKYVTEIARMTGYFFSAPTAYDQKAIRKHWKAPDQIERFEELCRRLDLQEWTIESIETVLRDYAGQLGVGAGKVIQPLRLAITGIAATPGMFEVMALLGKEQVLSRIKDAVDYLKEHPVRAEVPEVAA